MWHFKVKVKRALYLVVSGVLWGISPRLRREYIQYRDRAWDAGNCALDFSEYIGNRLFPDN
jgi:hypothetical protein